MYFRTTNNKKIIKKIKKMFCPVRQCLDTKFSLNDSRSHPRLCGLCLRLTHATIGKEMIKNTPPASV